MGKLVSLQAVQLKWQNLLMELNEDVMYKKDAAVTDFYYYMVPNRSRNSI